MQINLNFFLRSEKISISVFTQQLRDGEIERVSIDLCLLCLQERY